MALHRDGHGITNDANELEHTQTTGYHTRLSCSSMHVKSCGMNISQQAPSRKRGVVAVILRQDRLLVIRRSLTVVAPGLLCLPGGGIEEGETEPEALVREMQEELAINVTPNRLCWRSTTSWGTELAWWIADLSPEISPVANPDEVAEVHWLRRAEIRRADDMLPSLPKFLDAWERGEVDLPIDE